MSSQQTVWPGVNTFYIDPHLGDSNAFHDLAHYNQYQMAHEDYSCYDYGNIQTAPPPPVFMSRHLSPFDQRSSTCDSAYSPPSESDGSFDNPSTPDHNVMSPYTIQYDNFTSQGQLVQSAGLNNVCIKPEDINRYQEPPIYAMDKPEFPFRELSMSSNGSTCDLSIRSRQEPIQISRALSLAETSFIKQEIYAEPGSYPPLDDDDDDEDSSNDQKHYQADDIKDEDWRPRAAHQRTTSNTSRTPKQRKRTGSSVSISPAKKAKREYVAAITPKSTNKIHSITKGSLACDQCRDAVFKDQIGLQKHIKQQHTRPFICVFHFAGCDSTFASKNEWKRHVASQHLLLHYWLCDQDGCAKLSNTSASLTKATGTTKHRLSYPSQPEIACPALPNGAIFNRKDLYTQHLRRMHIPPSVKKQLKAKKTFPEWEDRVRVCQEEAHKLRCQLPEYMTCPATGCSFQASGSNSWDERMEHVAKHLERASSGLESMITFGGMNDPTLMNWVLRPDVAVVQQDAQGKLELHNPLKPQRSTKSLPNEYSEEDAPGEEVDY
ncbi:hypothetical protein BKA67DRAFT_304818 [Truncatella angustata]|uniref:C2H2-type domain-containing protein n=1 Tax=Truncatella angustata TaxID=152316 RepID=A0A9P8ZXB7_9PEZI|nr:uncharacterized protein BKA67DRAFT_304818 [Truncatella angustata]KAH6652923.1 hypothetical protein BKA67DRAFT_304818 [Truncatella angustata]